MNATYQDKQEAYLVKLARNELVLSREVYSPIDRKRAHRSRAHQEGFCGGMAGLCGTCGAEEFEILLAWARKQQQPDPTVTDPDYFLDYWKEIGGPMLDEWAHVSMTLIRESRTY